MKIKRVIGVILAISLLITGIVTIGTASEISTSFGGYEMTLSDDTWKIENSTLKKTTIGDWTPIATPNTQVMDGEVNFDALNTSLVTGGHIGVSLRKQTIDAPYFDDINGGYTVLFGNDYITILDGKTNATIQTVYTDKIKLNEFNNYKINMRDNVFTVYVNGFLVVTQTLLNIRGQGYMSLLAAGCTAEYKNLEITKFEDADLNKWDTKTNLYPANSIWNQSNSCIKMTTAGGWQDHATLKNTKVTNATISAMVKKDVVGGYTGITFRKTNVGDTYANEGSYSLMMADDHVQLMYNNALILGAKVDTLIFKPNQFNKVEIIINGRNVKVSINDALIFNDEYMLQSHISGYVSIGAGGSLCTYADFKIISHDLNNNIALDNIRTNVGTWQYDYSDENILRQTELNLGNWHSLAAIKDLNLVDGSIEFDAKNDSVATGGHIGISFRKKSGDAWYSAHPDGGYAILVGVDYVKLMDGRNSANSEILDIKTDKIKINEFNKYKLVLKENNIKLYINNALVLDSLLLSFDEDGYYTSLLAASCMASFKNFSYKSEDTIYDVPSIDEFKLGLGAWSEGNNIIKQTELNNNWYNMATYKNACTNVVMETVLKKDDGIGFVGINTAKEGIDDTYEQSGVSVLLNENTVMLYDSLTKSNLAVVNTPLKVADYNKLKIVVEGTDIKVYLNNSINPIIEKNNVIKNDKQGYISLLSANSLISVKSFTAKSGDISSIGNVKEADWIKYDGEWSYNNKIARQNVLSDNWYDMIVNKSTTVGNGEISAKLKKDSGDGFIGIHFRKQKQEDTYIQSGYSLLITDNTVIIYEASTGKNIITKQLNLNPYLYHDIKIKLDGLDIIVYIDDMENPVIEEKGIILSDDYGYVGILSAKSTMSLKLFEITKQSDTATDIIKDDWVFSGGKWQISNGALRQSLLNNNWYNMATNNSYFENGSIEAVMKKNKGEGFIGLTFRKDKKSDSYADSGVSVILGKDLIIIYDGTAKNNLATITNVNVDPSKYNKIKVVLKGRQVEIYINDKLIINDDKLITCDDGYVSLISAKSTGDFKSFIVKNTSPTPINMEIKDWTGVDGNWLIKGGSYVQTDENVGWYAMANYKNKVSDAQIEFDIRHDKGIGFGGITFRKDNLKDNYSLGGYSLIISNNNIQLFDGWNNWPLEIEKLENISSNSDIHVKIVLKGRFLEVYLNNSMIPVISRRDMVTSEVGYLSLISAKSGTSYSNFKINQLDSPKAEISIDDFTIVKGKWNMNAGTLRENENMEFWDNLAVSKKGVISDGIIKVEAKKEIGIGFPCINFRTSRPEDSFKESGYGLMIGHDFLWLMKAGESDPIVKVVPKNMKFNDYNIYEIVLNGASIKVYLNGSKTPTIDIVDQKFKDGYMSLTSANCQSSFAQFLVYNQPNNTVEAKYFNININTNTMLDPKEIKVMEDSELVVISFNVFKSAPFLFGIVGGIILFSAGITVFIIKRRKKKINE